MTGTVLETERLKVINLRLHDYEALISKDYDYFRQKGYYFETDLGLSRIASSFVSMLNLGCPPEYLGWLIIEKKTGKIIGDIGFKGTVKERTVEVGYSVIPSYQKKGIAKEAIRVLVFWSFMCLKIDEIEAMVVETNEASKRVLASCGFVYEASDADGVEYFRLHQRHFEFTYKQWFRKGYILTSACLLGFDTRYDGGSKRDENCLRLAQTYHMIPFCPEQLGGLTTPRQPSEIVSPFKVLSDKGLDVTQAFLKGAEISIEMSHFYDTRIFYMKANSPSCGAFHIYDGQFSGKKVSGSGMTVRAIRQTYDTYAIFDETQNLIFKGDL